jgi:hypothetical protein
MPIETLLVDGKQYLYFYCYDAAVKQKKRVYIGPASDSDSREKALMLEERYRSVQTVKKRILVHLSKVALRYAFGDSAAETERLAIVEDLENMGVVISGCPRRSRNRALLRERTSSSGRTVKSSILRLVEEAPRRYSEIQRNLGRPDKTVFVNLRALRQSGFVTKVGDRYTITEEGSRELQRESLKRLIDVYYVSNAV